MMLLSPMTRFSRIPAASALGALVLGLSLWAAPASAQSIKAVVNGAPITSLEVQERKALVRLTEKKNLTDKQVVDQMVDEVLVRQEASRRRVSVDDEDVNSRYNNVAQSTKLSLPQLAQALAQGGTSDRAFKNYIRSQLLQRKVFASRFDISNAVKESDISSQLEQRKEKRTAYRYTVRQIIFVLPKGASAADVQRRRQEALGFRNRFSSCEQAADFARNLRNVAVKEPAIRTTAQIGEALDKELSSLKIGGTTAPERGDQGVELIALCDRQTTEDDSALRQKIQFELADEKFKAERDKIMADLRKRAVIEYR
jgi:peptidyl-prolyl cis-trans isomerase SurA